MTLKINGATGGSVSLDAPDNTSPTGTDVTLTLPTSAGSSGQYLQTNGSGTLSWQTVAADAITEGNTSAEVVDTGSDGHFKVITENTEAIRIDSSQRLLVGTNEAYTGYGASAANRIQIAGNAYNNAAISAFVFGNTQYGGYLNLGLSRNTTIDSHTVVNNNDSTGAITFNGSDGSAFKAGASIEGYVDGTPGTNDMPGRLVFSTTADGASQPTERMRIQSNAVVSFANTTYVFPQTDNTIRLGDSFQRWTAVYAVNGTIQTSDKRQKTEIAESALGTEFVKSLRPVSYKWIEGGKRHNGEYDEDNNFVYESVPGQRTHWGFIAQEVKQAVDDAGVDFGGWVLTDKDDPDSDQALRYDQFIAPLTKALQEAIAKIETLETANASQAATIAALDARLTALEGGAA